MYSTYVTGRVLPVKGKSNNIDLKEMVVISMINRNLGITDYTIHLVLSDEGFRSRD